MSGSGLCPLFVSGLVFKMSFVVPARACASVRPMSRKAQACDPLPSVQHGRVFPRRRTPKGASCAGGFGTVVDAPPSRRRPGDCASLATETAVSAMLQRHLEAHALQLMSQTAGATSVPTSPGAPGTLCCLLYWLLDAPTALAACCGFDLCHKYILYHGGICICIVLALSHARIVRDPMTGAANTS